MDFQSQYEHLKRNATSKTRFFLIEKYPYIESILPYVYKDKAFTREELGGISTEEVNLIIDKISADIVSRGGKKLCFSRMLIDTSTLDYLQLNYSDSLNSLTKWTAKMIRLSNMQHVASIIPWMEGRYLKFCYLHPLKSSMSIEMDTIVERMRKDAKSLQRERWIVSNNHLVANQRNQFFLLQRKLDSLIGTLSTRARNVILKNGLDSIETFLAWADSDERDFSMLKQCGEIIVSELNTLSTEIETYRNLLQQREEIELSKTIYIPQKIKTNDPNVSLQTSLTKTQRDSTCFLFDNQINILDDNKKKEFLSLFQKLSVRAKHVLELNGLNYFKKFIEFAQGHNGDFIILKKCGENTANELKTMSKHLFGKGQLKMTVWNSIDINKIPSELAEYLQDQLNLFLSQKPYRTIELLRELRLDTMDALLQYIVAPLKESPFDSIHKNSGIRKDIEEMLSMLRSQLFSIAVGNQPSLVLSQEIPMSDQIHYSEEDILFAKEYMKSNGHWPMFFILSKYFEYTNLNKEITFATLWGIKTGTPLTIANAALQVGYTREGIKQNHIAVIKKPSPTILEILTHPDWNYYHLQDKLYFTEIEGRPCDEITKIAKAESINHPNSIFVLLQFFGFNILFVDNNFKVTSFPTKSYSTKIAIGNLLQGFHFKEAFNKIHQEIDRYSDQDRTFDLRRQITSKKTYWDIDDSMGKYDITVANILSVCIKPIVGKNITNLLITIPANSIDYSEELFWILKTAGTPLKKDELLRRLKEQHPDAPYTIPNQLNYWLKRDDRITNIGKSSYWKLKRVDEDGSGSIREYIISAVSNSDKPLTKAEICQKVLLNRPDTTKKSILAIIGQSLDIGELKLYYKDLIGLSNQFKESNYVQMPATFSEWAAAYKKFIYENERMPYSGQDGFEGYLYRWYYRSIQSSTLTDEESLILKKIEELLDMIPQKQSEYIFLQKCSKYRELAYFFPPLQIYEDYPELYAWFINTKKKYLSFTDKRKQMFEKLLEDIIHR